MQKNEAGELSLFTAPMLKAMRIVSIFLFAASLSVSANSLSQQVSLTAREMSLKNVFSAVEKQTGYVFFYNQQLLANTTPITISVRQALLHDFLEAVLSDQPLNFRIEGKTITLSRKPIPFPSPSNRTYDALADTLRTITGVVTADGGELIPGASIIVKGTNRGASTSSLGTFSIKADEGQVLVISAVGYETTEIRVKGANRIVVKMVVAADAMQDQIVTGIYQRKKESFTGSATTISGKELKIIGNQNALQALKTLDPSFAIIENSLFGSDPNRLPDIEIRGKSSVIGLSEEYGTNPNQPLFILDGFESTLAVISDFSMDRIETITILKDAAATAIYGSKAANGVVVVESKRPTPGKLRLNYSLNSSFNFADLSDYNLMNAEEKLEYEKSSMFLGSINANGDFVVPDADTKYQSKLAEVKRGVNTFWMNEPLRFALVHRHNLFVEGGDANFRYGATLSYGDNQGVMKGSNRDVTNGNIRLIYRKGKISVNNSLSIDMVNATRETVPFSAFSRANPYFRKYNEAGGMDKVLSSFTYSSAALVLNTETYYNPLWDMKNNNVNKSLSQGFTNNLEIDWRVLEELRARVRVGLIKTALHGEIFKSPFNSEFAQVDPLVQGSFFESNDRQTNYDGELTLTYGKLIADKHMVNMVGGMRTTDVSAVSSAYEVRGFVDDKFPNAAFAYDYSESKRAAYMDSKRRTASYYLNTSYAYDERYLIDATMRADGASVFGAEKQMTTIWSLGLAWNLHKESFFRNYAYSWVNSFRLRGSIGNPGNQNFNDYISNRLYRYNNENRNPFGPSVIVINHGNPSLRWQKTIDRNIGIDVQMIDNRLRINAEYFVKTTDPLLVFASLPSSAGVTSYTDNLGGQEQKGFTLIANYRIINRDAFTWNINLNGRQLRSKYLDFGNSLTNFNEKNKGVNMTRYYDGASPADLWAVPSLGIDPATGREVFLTKQGTQSFAHDFRDEVVVGNSDPKLEGVIGSSVFYKGFSANVGLRYRYGGQAFMQTLYNKVENIPFQNIGLNQDRRALTERWQKPGDNAKFKSIRESRSNPMTSRFVEDDNLIAGESISVGYETMSSKWLKSIGASSVSFRVYMNDIFRISTILNERGIDYPFARSVSFSMGLRF